MASSKHTIQIFIIGVKERIYERAVEKNRLLVSDVCADSYVYIHYSADNFRDGDMFYKLPVLSGFGNSCVYKS